MDGNIVRTWLHFASFGNPCYSNASLFIIIIQYLSPLLHVQCKQEERTSNSVDDNGEHSETETENDPQEKNQESKSLINTKP